MTEYEDDRINRQFQSVTRQIEQLRLDLRFLRENVDRWDAARRLLNIDVKSVKGRLKAIEEAK